jgi:xanthine dehydrogenase accessory factor
MSARHLIESFARWRASAAPLVLATVFETAGSTYSKAGHRILIAANGDYRGLVSGGCLEGDLAERAREVIASGRSRAVTYDLRDEADELWGLGIGCNGLLRVFLQPLTAAGGYEPFATIAECLSGTQRGAVATLVDAPEGLPPGGTVVHLQGAARTFGDVGSAATSLADAARGAVGAAHATLLDVGGTHILAAPLRPIPRLLVLGGGLDAVPLVAMAAELGWSVTVADHRPAYVARPGFERAARVALVEPGKLEAELALGEFDAIVVMSHHLATDRKYLAELAGVRSSYLGVLGPRARRDRLLRELATVAPELAGRLRGPVGLDIGADSPETIALSILAELQATLSGR